MGLIWGGGQLFGFLLKWEGPKTGPKGGVWQSALKVANFDRCKVGRNRKRSKKSPILGYFRSLGGFLFLGFPKKIPRKAVGSNFLGGSDFGGLILGRFVLSWGERCA